MNNSTPDLAALARELIDWQRKDAGIFGARSDAEARLEATILAKLESVATLSRTACRAEALEEGAKARAGYHYTRDGHGIIDAVCKMFERGTFSLGEGDALTRVQDAYITYRDYHARALASDPALGKVR